MKTCKNCGYEVDDNHKFCPECGTSINDDVVDEQKTTTDTIESRNTNISSLQHSSNEEVEVNRGICEGDDHSSLKSNKKRTIGVVIALLVLCFAGYFIYNATATVTSLSVTYEGDTEMGTTLDSNNKGFIVKEIYSNGLEKTVDDWKIKIPHRLAADSTSTVHIIYKDWDVPVEIKCTTVLDSIEAEYNGSTEPGTAIVKDDITVKTIYSNGTTHTLRDYKLDGEHVLKSGKTEAIKITYKDKECTLYVQCDIKKPTLNGNVIDCTAEEFINYLDYLTIDEFVIKENSKSENKDGSISKVYDLYANDEPYNNLLITEKDGHVILLFSSMAEGKNIGDSYAWALMLASIIDDTLDRENDDIKAELVQNEKLTHNGLTIWNTSSITNGRYSCLIAPAENESDMEEMIESEVQPKESIPSGINTNESDWNKWKSAHSVSLINFMAAAKELNFTWTIPENSSSKDKICYYVDENGNEVEGLYMMYGVKSNKVTYAALYTENEEVLESDKYKQCLNKIMQAYTAEHEGGEVSTVVSDERATEIIDYLVDNRVEHCLVDGMKIRGLFSEDDGVYGITIGY